MKLTTGLPLRVLPSSRKYGPLKGRTEHELIGTLEGGGMGRGGGGRQETDRYDSTGIIASKQPLFPSHWIQVGLAQRREDLPGGGFGSLPREANF